jgi:hypothetical protein
MTFIKAQVFEARTIIHSVDTCKQKKKELKMELEKKTLQQK